MISQKLVQQDLSRKGRVSFGLRGLEKDGVAYSIKLVRDLQRELNAFSQNKLFEQIIKGARMIEDKGIGKNLETSAEELYRPMNAFNKALSKFVNNAEKFLK